MQSMDSSQHRNQRERQHHDNIDAQTPKQGAHSEGEIAWSKMSSSLRRNHLVRFEQRQNDARVSQVGLFHAGGGPFQFEPCPITVRIW